MSVLRICGVNCVIKSAQIIVMVAAGLLMGNVIVAWQDLQAQHATYHAMVSNATSALLENGARNAIKIVENSVLVDAKYLMAVAMLVRTVSRVNFAIQDVTLPIVLPVIRILEIVKFV